MEEISIQHLSFSARDEELGGIKYRKESELPIGIDIPIGCRHLSLFGARRLLQYG